MSNLLKLYKIVKVLWFKYLSYKQINKGFKYEEYKLDLNLKSMIEIIIVYLGFKHRILDHTVFKFKNGYKTIYLNDIETMFNELVNVVNRSLILKTKHENAINRLYTYSDISRYKFEESEELDEI